MKTQTMKIATWTSRMCLILFIHLFYYHCLSVSNTCFICLQVQLQNILMSKYVEYFQAEVSGWQKKLMVADLVISSWMSVQRTWAHLNSIFTNSHDIRCQLANDAERFRGIHTDFQVTHPHGRARASSATSFYLNIVFPLCSCFLFNSFWCHRA